MLTLHNLKRFVGSKKKRKRIGRGNASGHGTYATRGMKGQKARTGGRAGLIKKGLRTTLQRIPKIKGFKHLKLDFEIVNLKDLEKNFQTGNLCQPKDFLIKGLIKDTRRVKILGEGKLTKRLKIVAHQFSKSARNAIIKAGGEAIVIK